MGWCLALMPTFAPKQTVKVLVSMSKLELYSEEVSACAYTKRVCMPM